MGYMPKHAKPASLKDAALSHSLFAINTPSVGRHAASASTAGTANADVAASAAGATRLELATGSEQPVKANPPQAA